MKWDTKFSRYVEDNAASLRELLLTLAQIPAPSGDEGKRAEFCRAWLEEQGAEGVFIDEALNVVYPIGCEDAESVAVYMAHSDVVFPDTEPLPLEIRDGRIYSPGVGDDTANAVALLAAARYIAINRLQPKDGGLVLVINAGEEGLGNLKGCRAIMERYDKRIREFVSFDSATASCVNTAVGSKRYRVEIDTEGGHSYGKFGNRNAIAYLASLIDTLYTMKVPEGGKTTYNVGTISGGTSVNTIAQHAEMLYEFRSDVKEHIETMEEHFNAAIAFYRTKGIRVTVTLLGNRPCGIEVDRERAEALAARAAAAIKRHFGEEMVFRSGSTDSNLPLSMGIPAITIGCVRGAGAHTRGEYVEEASLAPGIGVAMEMILHHI